MRTGAGLYIYNIKQVRLPDHPVWSFVGRGHNWRSLCPLHIIEDLHLYRWNTHTPRRSGADEVTMKVRWQWKWNEQYLTRTRRGEHKRRGTERTPTRHTWPGTGKPWKGKGKEKRRPTDNGTRPAEGGKDGSAWTNLTRREPTHEKRDPWGITLVLFNVDVVAKKTSTNVLVQMHPDGHV